MAGPQEMSTQLEPLYRQLCAWGAQSVPPGPETLLGRLNEASERVLALSYLPQGGRASRGQGVGRGARHLLGQQASKAESMSTRPGHRVSGPWRVQPAMGDGGLRGHLIIRTSTPEDLEDPGWEAVADGVAGLLARGASHQRSKHLVALGARSASLVHDLRNRLTGVMLEVCRARLDQDTGVLESTENHLMDASDLCGSALDIQVGEGLAAHGACPASRRWDLGQVAHSALERARGTVRPGAAPLPAQLTDDLSSGGEVFANRALLEDALVNLIVNAAEAAGPRGKVQVGLARERGLAGVWVQDDGRGLPPEATEPGATSGGTGHGLSGAIECAQRHGGELNGSRTNGRTRLQLMGLDANHLAGDWQIHWDCMPSRLARRGSNARDTELRTSLLPVAIRWMELLTPEAPGVIHAWRGAPGLSHLVELVGGWGGKHVRLVVHSAGH